MKLNPNNLTTPKQIRVNERAQSLMKAVDSCYEATRAADNTPVDKHPEVGQVAVSRLNAGQDGVTIMQGVLAPNGRFTAELSCPGYMDAWGYSGPTSVPERVSRIETPEQVTYDRQEEWSSTKNRAKVTVDKQTGEVDYREYHHGFLRKRL